MQQFKIKISEQCSQWKLSKREFGQFRRNYNLGVSYKDFVNELNGLYVYYLNDIGLSVNLDGSSVEKESAQYMLAQLVRTFDKEPLYAWMYPKGNGEFKNITLGTRTEFDKEIVKNQNKEQEYEYAGNTL